MSKSDDIRRLAGQGMATADIARQLGLRYQHVYQVLRSAVPTNKPPLTVDYLVAHGFHRAGEWQLSLAGGLELRQPISKEVGVYAFAQDGVVQYVGVATMGLAKRIYFYGRPGPRQATSIRLNAMLKEELAAARGVEILIATPPDLEWNNLPVHGAAGLELGLIKKFSLPWNKRSANSA